MEKEEQKWLIVSPRKFKGKKKKDLHGKKWETLEGGAWKGHLMSKFWTCEV